MATTFQPKPEIEVPLADLASRLQKDLLLIQTLVGEAGQINKALEIWSIH